MAVHRELHKILEQELSSRDLHITPYINGYIIKIGCVTAVLEIAPAVLGRMLELLYRSPSDFIANYGERFKEVLTCLEFRSPHVIAGGCAESPSQEAESPSQ